MIRRYTPPKSSPKPIKHDHCWLTSPSHPSLLGAGGVGSLGSVARVQGLLGGTAVDIYVVVGPGGYVAQS